MLGSYFTTSFPLYGFRPGAHHIHTSTLRVGIWQSHHPVLLRLSRLVRRVWLVVHRPHTGSLLLGRSLSLSPIIRHSTDSLKPGQSRATEAASLRESLCSTPETSSGSEGSANTLKAKRLDSCPKLFLYGKSAQTSKNPVCSSRQLPASQPGPRVTRKRLEVNTALPRARKSLHPTMGVCVSNLPNLSSLSKVAA